MVFTALDLFKVTEVRDIYRSFRHLSLTYHPDKVKGKTGDHANIMKYLSSIKHKISEKNDNVSIDCFPIFLDYNDLKIPILVKEDASDLDQKIDQHSGAKIEDLIYRFDKLTPWCSIYLFKKMATTDIQFIRNVFKPILDAFPANILSNLIKEFIVGGKANFRALIGTDGEATLKFKGRADIIIKASGKISPRDLTFNRFCAILGEINRQLFEERKEIHLPGLSRYLTLAQDVPVIFPLYLHHGVYFSWSFNVSNKNHLRNNRSIYMAIKSLDFIFYNIDLKRRGEPIIESLNIFLGINPPKQTWTHDTVKFIGRNVFVEFELEQAEFIRTVSPKIKYNDF